MAEEVKPFGGFDAFANVFLGGDDSGEQAIVDPEELKRQMESLDNINNKVEDPKGQPATKTTESSEEEDVETEEEAEEESIEEEPTEGDENYTEEELVDMFSDLFAGELGWEFDEGEKPKNVKDLIGYIQELIETSSVPNYSNEDVKALDEFVRNGGDPKDFVSKVWSLEVDPESLDLTREEHQKAIIRENLRNRGYKNERIEKLIERYEEANSLEEEANDSLEEVKEYRENNKKKLLEDKKNQRNEQLRQQQAFVQNVEKVIEDTNSIAGLELTKKEKQTLKDYIFKPERDGLTKYQKYINSNTPENLMTSAYLAMKGKDTFQKQLQQKATTDATNKLRLKLKSKGKSTKNTAPEDTDTSKSGRNLWDVASVLTANK